MISSRFYSPGKVGPDDLTWSLPTCLVLWFCEPSLVWLKLSCFPLNTAGVARGSCVPRLHQPRLWKLVGRRVQTVPRCCAVRWDLDCKLFKLAFVLFLTKPVQDRCGLNSVCTESERAAYWAAGVSTGDVFWPGLTMCLCWFCFFSPRGLHAKETLLRDTWGWPYVGTMCTWAPLAIAFREEMRCNSCDMMLICM